MPDIAGLSHRYADGHRVVGGGEPHVRRGEPHVRRGETAGVVGPTGRGGTTPPRCVAGVRRPSGAGRAVRRP